MPASAASIAAAPECVSAWTAWRGNPALGDAQSTRTSVACPTQLCRAHLTRNPAFQLQSNHLQPPRPRLLRPSRPRRPPLRSQQRRLPRNRGRTRRRRRTGRRPASMTSSRQWPPPRWTRAWEDVCWHCVCMCVYAEVCRCVKVGTVCVYVGPGPRWAREVTGGHTWKPTRACCINAHSRMDRRELAAWGGAQGGGARCGGGGVCFSITGAMSMGRGVQRQQRRRAARRQRQLDLPACTRIWICAGWHMDLTHTHTYTYTYIQTCALVVLLNRKHLRASCPLAHTCRWRRRWMSRTCP